VLNAMMETFFKSELIWPVAWQPRQQTENAVARYIDGFYKPVRVVLLANNGYGSILLS